MATIEERSKKKKIVYLCVIIPMFTIWNSVAD